MVVMARGQESGELFWGKARRHRVALVPLELEWE